MSREWRNFGFGDIFSILITSFAAYYIARNGLSLLYPETPKRNPELSRRLEGMLADREAQHEDEDSSDDESEDTPPNGYPHSRSPSHETSSQPTSRHRSKPPRPTKSISKLNLTSYEQTIAGEVVHPTEIPITFADIGGLDPLIADLQESVIYPLTLPTLYRHSSPLFSAPSGVLLYGPPGCGKTMLAKALAAESGAIFINLHISTLTEKWYGDSNKLVAAAFSLARKLAPAIIFVDEIDAVLGTRRSGEHEASGMVKAEFMTHWDGLDSAEEKGSRAPQRVLVLGATNRPRDIDPAIMRRMPKQFAVGLPDERQRRKIFQIVLRDAKVDRGTGVAEADEQTEEGTKPAFDLDELVARSEGLSGSDIREVCREATMVPVRESIQALKAQGKALKRMKPGQLRGIRTEDFSHYLGRRTPRGVPAAIGQGRTIEELDEEDEWKDEVNAKREDSRHAQGADITA